jgi:hypothetical protein
MDNQKHEEKDEWVVALLGINQSILNAIGTNPITWVRNYAMYCFSVVGLLAITLLYTMTNASGPFVLEVITHYAVLSTFSTLVGGIGYISIRKSLAAADGIKSVELAVSYFKILWILGVVVAPIIYLLTGLGHIDCGNSCVSSVIASDFAANLYYATFIGIPLYLWFQTKKMVKSIKIQLERKV